MLNFRLDLISLETISHMMRPNPQRMTFPRRNVFLPLWLLVFPSVRSMPLLGNRFNTTTNVTEIINLAKDIAAMRDSSSKDEKRNIYSNGLNAYDEHGSLISLASLSLNSNSSMSEDPLYNIFRYAYTILGNETEKEPWGMFDDSPVEQYGNTIVHDLFDLNFTDIESEAALAMNVWMSMAHELYVLLRACKSKSDGYQNDMNAALDRAAAFWIGDQEQTGETGNGNFLYNLAEKMGQRFNQRLRGEAAVNWNVITLLNQMQSDIQSLTCANPDGYSQTRKNVHSMIGNMTVVLVQELVRNMFEVESEGSSNFAALYALALLPRVLACDPSTYTTMLSSLVLNNLVASEAGTALTALQSAYSCLDVTCEDIGSYQEEVARQCIQVYNSSSPLPLAGYIPSTNVLMKSYIDRDILRIRILMETNAYAAAEDCFTYGDSSDLSLQQLYSVSVSQTTPIVSLFREYFQKSGDEVSGLIVGILNQTIFIDAPSEQRTEIVVGLLRHVVTYVAVVAQFELATVQCRSNTTAAAQLWDNAAAYFIGSIEGGQDGGQPDGQLLFAAAKEFCIHFGTCSNSDADANLAIVDGLDEGKPAIAAGSCEQATFILNSFISPQLAVILLQGLVWQASVNAKLPAGTSNGSVGEASALAVAVLPLLQNTSANVIQINFIFPPVSDPIPGGFDAVFFTLKTALPSILNMTIQCSDLGIFLENNETFCPSVSAPSASSAPAGSPVPAPSLAFQRYNFSDAPAAEGFAKFSMDVRDMYHASDVVDASNIYFNGKNAVTEGLNGTVALQSLASLSTEAATYMDQDPIFNFYRYALLKEEEYQEGSDPKNSSYGDIIVRQAFENGNDVKLASEAAVVMIIFQLIAHKLNQAIVNCENGTNVPGAIDAAVALWIGQEQIQGLYNSGWMLYSIAQKAWYAFGNKDGEAVVNSQLMELFKDAGQLANTCSSGMSNFLKLRIATTRIMQLLSLPLLQRLLYFISIQDENLVQLYSLSVLPLAQAVMPSGFPYLDNLLTNQTFIDIILSNTTTRDDFFDAIAAFSIGMRYSCDDFDATQDANQNLTSIVDSLCEKIQARSSQFDLAGYEPVTNVVEQARLDLDILQIEILMKTGAFQAAKRFYQYGQNSFSDKGTRRSLQGLATSNFRKVASSQYDLFLNFFKSPNYADDIMLNTLVQNGTYSQSSREQRTEIVVLTMRSLITYMEICWRLSSAITKCRASLDGINDLDNAVALYVGSIESTMALSDFSDGGKFLFSLSKEMCSYFGTCTLSGNADINDVVISAFNDTKVQLQSSDCDLANSTLYNYVFTSLAVPLIQGTLYYAYINSGIKGPATQGNLASGFIISESVLPLVNASRPLSADTIQRNLALYGNPQPVPDGYGKVLDAFAVALSGMGLSCDSIGSLEDGRTLCVNLTGANRPHLPQAGSNSTTSTGAYVFSSYVQDVAKIALDVRDIRESLVAGKSVLKNGKSNLAEDIYKYGKNSYVYNAKGAAVGFRSLNGLSTNASYYMLEEPTFNLYRYALQDENGQFMGRDVMFYADSIVTSLFNSSHPDTRKIAVDAVLILNVWMYTAHQLYEVLDNCKNKSITGSNAIDVAVAYWIGDGQVNGARGNLLYGLAEMYGQIFKTMVGGQSWANQNILRLFNEAKFQLSPPNACSRNPSTYPTLFRLANEIIRQMTIPLIQGLIENLLKNRRYQSILYAQAFVPLVSACNPTVFNYLKQELILSTYNVVDVNQIISHVTSTFNCFGIKCDDIGVFPSGPPCVDSPFIQPVAGYTPTTDVGMFAQIDRDILEMDILLRMQAYQAAHDLYTYGKHATVSNDFGATTISLAQLSTTSARTVVPQYDSFVRYFSDSKYADSVVQNGFNFNNLQSLSNDQRRELVLATCQYMILYMAGLQAMYSSVENCHTNARRSSNQTDTSWDEAAAYLIGSLEGSKVNGSSDGRLIFALANSQCDEFGTCSSPGYAGLNERIISLLYTGRGAYISNTCSALLKATKELQHLLLVPFIQGTLSTSIALSQVSQTSDTLVSFGYVLSRSILPLVADANRDAASAIAQNFDITSNDRPVPSGVAAVFDAFSQSYLGMGVDCSLVGVAYNIDSCTADYTGSQNSLNIGLIVGVPVSVLGFLALIWLLCFAKRKVLRDVPESKPVFVVSNGVFDHGDTEMLNGEHFDASSPTDDDTAEDQDNFEDADLIPPQEEQENFKIV